MQRGNGIFNTLFSDDTPQVIEKQSKGRNGDLIAERNEFLLDRYFYYGFYTDKRNAVVLALMQKEVFLTERRIYDIVSENITYLTELRKAPPTVKALAQKYPHVTW